MKIINDCLDRWYVWVCLTIMVGIICVFVVAMSYSLHPTEIRVYANGELMNVTKFALQTQRDFRFNDCIAGCVDDKDLENNCYVYCIDYYE